MHYDLIILSNSKLNNPKINILNYKIYSDELFLVNNYTLNNEDNFDYIIVENPKSLKNIDILKDNTTIICNCFMQTSVDHIFFIGSENNSSFSISEQLDIVLDFLIN